MTTGKAIALTIWTFVDEVMSLLFNMPSIYKNTFCNNYTIEFNMNVNLGKDSIIILANIILKL